MRQGDILLMKIDKEEIPKDAKVSDNKVVAYGEATGHHHEFTGQVTILRTPQAISECRTGQFAITEDATLKHQEHEHQKYKRRVIEVRQQRELSMLGEVRKVMD